MEERRIAVLFYGLFMDVTILKDRNVYPARVRRASVPGFTLRIGKRAALVPDPQGRAHGMLMQLTHEEIDTLYSDPTVSMYRPEAVLCEEIDGVVEPALCFNLPSPPQMGESNAQYAEKLRTLAKKLQLPSDYIGAII